MRIEFIAHACFMLTFRSGRRLVTDPYSTSFTFKDRFRYPAFETACDWVTISHEHVDHNDTSALQGNFEVIRGDYESPELRVTSFSAFHDIYQGTKFGGSVSMKVIDAEKIRICHTGDIGECLSAERCALMGEIDVLILPVGGFYTIDYEGALDLIRKISPKIVVPSHFATNLCSLPMDTCEPFLRAYEKTFGEIDVHSDNILEIDEQYLSRLEKSSPRCVFLQDKFGSFPPWHSDSCTPLT